MRASFRFRFPCGRIQKSCAGMNDSKLVVNGKEVDAFALRALDGPVMFERRGDALLVDQLPEAPMVHRHLCMVWGAFALFAVLFIVAPLALAVPKIENRQGCVVFADAAVVAAAGVKHKLAREVLNALLHDVYKVNAKESEEIMQFVLDVLYAHPDLAKEPGEFSRLLFGTCMRNEGSLDSILGEKT